jgi:nucleoid-associated protein YgaU
VVAVSLLILPPAGADQDSPPESIAGVVQTATPTPEATEDPEATAAPDGTAAPGGTAEPGGTGTPGATETATSTPTAEPTQEPEEIIYTIQSGDTLNGIAQQFAPEGVSTAEMADRIAEANGITNPSSIQLGQELVIPQ